MEIEEILDDSLSCECSAKENYFIEIPLKRQLKSFYQRPDFYNKLFHQGRFSNNNNESLKNIYNGSVYRDLAEEGNILSNKNNICFLWYTDCVSIFRSLKYSVWGFFLVILELPYKERYKLENILLVSLWFGEKKPIPNLFLKPLKNILRDMYKGVEFYVKDLNRTIIVRGLIACGNSRFAR